MTDSNPYEDLNPMDLSDAKFEKLEGLDEAKVKHLVEQVEHLTKNNISDAAKWNGFVRLINGTLHSAGLVARIVAAT